MELLILLAIVAFIVLALFGKQGGESGEVSYEKNEPLFTPAERSFFGILDQALNGQAVVFGKVRVADVLRPPKGLGRSNWQKAFNRISSKHFDYVICTADTLSVLAVIELDDRSHLKGKRAERDRFLKSACSSAGLPLHRFKASTTYKIKEVRNVIFPPQKSSVEEPLLTKSAKTGEEKRQLCPRCSSLLVKKVAKKGKHKGSEFIACSAFPKCRYLRNGDS